MFEPRGGPRVSAGVAIAGVAESDLGEVAPGLTPVDLMAQASLRALEDCGLTVADVDGLFAATTQLPMAPLNLGEYLGIAPALHRTPRRSAARRSWPTSTTRARRSAPGCATSR